MKRYARDEELHFIVLSNEFFLAYFFDFKYDCSLVLGSMNNKRESRAKKTQSTDICD